MSSHGRRGFVSGGDHSKQREENAAAPKIPNLGKRIAELFRPYRAQLTLIIVLVFVSAVLGIIPPLLTERVFDDGLFPPEGGPNLSVLTWLVVAMIIVFAVSSGLGIVQTVFTARVGNRVMGDLRMRLFSHLQSMELAFFTRTKTGVIQSRLQNDVGGVANVLTNTVSNVIGNTVTVIAALVAMLILSWELTIVAVVLMPLLVFVQRRVGQVRARIAGKTQESLSEMTAITQESLSVSGVLLAKTYSRQAAETARYDVENRNQIDLQVRLTMSGQWFFAVVNVFLSAIPAVVYLISGWLIALSTGQSIGSDITAGTIVAFTTVQSRLLFPMMALMRVALDLQTSSALFARIFEYLDLKPSVVDAPNAKDPRRADGAAATAAMMTQITAAERNQVDGAIEFENVSFRYPDAKPHERPTLDRVSFRVDRGEFVAFVGASGSGKTTISYLIARLYDATDGVVRYGGDDVRSLKQEALMNEIGMVTQESYLFHASIADNLRYAKPAASDAELVAAARQANIHETIETFADKYDTIVGERGYRLSGGEKQRIAIARVLLKNPPVLILDEATSALDTLGERIVQQALDQARAGRTAVAIAHRLSTIIDADRIYVLGAGRILEQGTHESLLAARGAYADLYAEQRDSPESGRIDSGDAREADPGTAPA